MNKSLTLEKFYTQSLGLQAPWRVVSIVIDGNLKEVQVRVECAAGEAWADPDTRTRALIKDWQERTWRHLDTCEYQTVISARVPRVVLSNGQTQTVQVPWAEPKGRFTKRFETSVIELLLQCRTVRGAAKLARITEDQADGVMTRAVERGLKRRKAESLTYIGFDEKSISKGHRYATILSDLEKGRVLDVAEDRTEEVATDLLARQPAESLRSIKAAAMDMWPAYRNAVEKTLSKVCIVYDRFHVKKQLNEAVDKVRRQEHRELSAAGNLILNKTRFIWLRTHERMTEKAAIAFRKLMVADLQTGTAWAVKENFDRLWRYERWGWAMRFMESWVTVARETGLRPLVKAAEMIEKHSVGILNYIHYRITNAGAEGINSVIQNLKHAAKGLPNFTSFRRRVLFFLGKLDLSPA
jgi:transposase